MRLERPFRALIAVPRWGVSTARAFARMRHVKYGLTAWEAKLRFARKIRRKRLRPEWALRLGNALEDVLADRRPDFVSLRERLGNAGAALVHLSGSGSAVFGLLEPGTSFSTVANRFVGLEALYGVGSMRAGMRLRRLS
jgi:4-diphosphocytidyl-2C-methyl-D-erythritol kinase